MHGRAKKVWRMKKIFMLKCVIYTSKIAQNTCQYNGNHTLTLFLPEINIKNMYLIDQTKPL
jgi:hypothetical protein